MEQQPDKRQELCDSFRAALKKHISERYFDEDELVTIFDFAGDLQDDYIRLEVLLLGARLFPESEMLKERRAIFYDDYDTSLSEKFLSDNEDCHSAIAEIIRMRNDKSIDIMNVDAALDYLISQYDSFNEEEIIQLICTVEEKSGAYWLLQNIENLVKKTNFPQIVYFEAGMLFDRESLYDASAKMFDKLVELEPYDADYWRILAMAHINCEEYQQAQQALDYCLAISPNDPETTLLKVKLTKELAGNDKALAKLIEAYNTNSHNLNTAKLLIMMYNEQGSKLELKQFLKAANREYPNDLHILSQALCHKACNAKEALKNFFNTNEAEEMDGKMWSAFVFFLINNGLYSAATEAASAYRKHHEVEIEDLILIPLAYYYAGKYGKCLDKLTELSVEVEHSDFCNVMEFNLLWATTLAKLGASEAALMLLNEMPGAFDDLEKSTFGHTMYLKGMASVANDLIKRLNGEIPTDWETYDPLSTDFPQD